ncbi:MAG: hypothetical protein KAH04_06750, partial [Psychrilyobacter sp.]|nr:hypothetical protein [Psychrilyobacter sp.]
AIKSSAVAKETFTNRFGISYGLKGSESIDDKKVLDTEGNNLYNDSLGIDYKLLYNLTNKFRWGAEFGITNTTMSSESEKMLEKKGYELKQDSMITLMLGPTLEYDLYSGDYVSFYLNGSGGLSLGMQDATYKKT